MKKGCLYWLILGWWLEPILYLIQQTRIVVWIAAVAVLIGFLMMAGAFLVAMAFIFCRSGRFHHRSQYDYRIDTKYPFSAHLRY